MPGSLFLIASYPKSGNTWTRLVIQNLLREQQPGAINAIDIGGYGYQRRMLFDSIMPAAAADLHATELTDALPAFYGQMAREADDTLYLKTHEQLRRTRQREWIFPVDPVRGVIYIVRHPFDVAASLASHWSVSPAEAVDILQQADAVIAPQHSSLPLPLPEQPGSWSDHVNSWTATAVPYPVTVVRYEDLWSDPIGGFGVVMKAIGQPYDGERLQRAVQNARFDIVQATEAREGFRERPRAPTPFFRSGHPQGWRELLSPELCRRLGDAHGETMARAGYRLDGGWQRTCSDAG